MTLLSAEALPLPAFHARYGALPQIDARLLDVVEASGLLGRGGGAFPTARKLRAVRSRRGAVVVGNGTEGEPASFKDAVLIDRNPHLVIDGALVAAELVRARFVVLAAGRAGSGPGRLEAALAERGDARHVSVAAVPDRFVAGNEGALVHWLNGGEAKPTTAPPRPFERGVDRRPTLVQNVETLANLALIARYGSDTFRSRETVLATVGGAVVRPGVVEVPLGTPLAELLARTGGLREPAQAYLVGGYFGRWVDAREDFALGPDGAGARVVVALGAGSCGVRETARVAAYLADESAGQCGPCVFGLRALAERLDAISHCTTAARDAYAHLARLDRQIARRGACAHPDGALGFVASATRVFAREFALHLEGACAARDHRPVLPTPASDGAWR
jgi:NADH:ubiquinone oxidoreductase subunit F (NADH-binding)